MKYQSREEFEQADSFVSGAAQRVYSALQASLSARNESILQAKGELK